MKVEELFQLCCGMFGEGKDSCKVWRDGFLAMVNSALAECFDIENGIRQSKGEKPWDLPQVVSGFEDVLMYDEELIRRCILWGVCTLLATADDDAMKANLFNNKYEYEKMFALRGRWVETEDCY